MLEQICTIGQISLVAVSVKLAGTKIRYARFCSFKSILTNNANRGSASINLLCLRPLAFRYAFALLNVNASRALLSKLADVLVVNFLTIKNKFLVKPKVLCSGTDNRKRPNDLTSKLICSSALKFVSFKPITINN